ncbi:hypothetical protein ABMY44_03715 [Pseudoalteromonas sp. Cnat2-41]|uniref:hypothetical protein n=1 Tax=unclassified Pseudoalteromonas TaxID=194690 RepID=UPI001EF87392|nr:MULTISPECIES: hypothetical protein [unclassified Pseudoalteromonas]MCF2861268.1 hypothetical protein [Pseudoalteromonas sp. CNAT2-18]MCG7557693.1 hypothetical protein [Pseudoalteromonas sp. CNAT2-18.1]MCG7565290.1 hypothetical protein [Pseudoalteromonas sp. CnMc7-15]
MRIHSLILFALLTTGCSEPQSISATTSQQALVQLNAKLTGDLTSPLTPWPYSDAYLKQRHDLYQQFDRAALSNAQRATLDYLITEQRYVRRYQPWPLSSAIFRSEQALQDSQTQEQAAQWLELVKSRLQQGEQSQIFVNRYELAMMQGEVERLIELADNSKLKSAAAQLQQYLANYRPRNQLGLSQLPNGTQWYQAKLNYYTGRVQAPIKWLMQIQSKLATLSEYGIAPLRQPDNDQRDVGLDWRQGYVNKRLWAQQQSLSVEQTRLALLYMELDIGIHSQLWTEQMALTSLAKQGISERRAKQMVYEVVAYPAMSFIYGHLIARD